MKAIHLVHLYARELNIYGDTGNLLVLKKRLEWRGIPVKVSFVGVGEELPEDADFILGGGGQDAAQSDVETDLIARKKQLEQMSQEGVCMLLICGTYQLFGRKFVLKDGSEIRGLGILPLETRAEEGRLIGNTTVRRGEYEIVGYENHSGRTYLDASATPFARVVRGKGNNDNGQDEGCEYNNIFGTYMHGPVLSKNSELADEILTRILVRRGVTTLIPLDDALEHEAHAIAKKRPR